MREKMGTFGFRVIVVGSLVVVDRPLRAML